MKLSDSSLFERKWRQDQGYVNKGTLSNVELYLGEDSVDVIDDSDEYYDDGFTLDSFDALENEIILPANVFNVVYPDSHFSNDKGIDFQTANTNEVEEFDYTH